MRKISKKKNLRVIIFLIILFSTSLLISIVKIINWYQDNLENKKIREKTFQLITIKKDEVNEKNNLYQIDFASLKEMNNETVAWLKVNNTNIEYLVVKSKDNKYYLNHNFEKKENKAGWIFADYRNKLDGSDKNIVIYGHNMKDKSMFGTLKTILNKNWYENKENYIIDFVTEYEYQQYHVFSIYQIEKEDYYIKTNFNNNEYLTFLNTIKNRSIKNFNIELSGNDTILTLSTCSNNNKSRIVLHARKINND